MLQKGEERGQAGNGHKNIKKTCHTGPLTLTRWIHHPPGKLLVSGRNSAGAPSMSARWGFHSLHNTPCQSFRHPSARNGRCGGRRPPSPAGQAADRTSRHPPTRPLPRAGRHSQENPFCDTGMKARSASLRGCSKGSAQDGYARGFDTVGRDGTDHDATKCCSTVQQHKDTVLLKLSAQCLTKN